MKHSDFKIGQEFHCAERKWRCTDIGTRVIVAVRADYVEKITSDGVTQTSQTHRLTEQDFAGPPYWLSETVFDESDIEACEPIKSL